MRRDQLGGCDSSVIVAEQELDLTTLNAGLTAISAEL